VASVVDICNLALGHIGDAATISSIDPPEGSAQAEHCARFYPIARDVLLETHSWGFATKRINLALLSSGFPEWDYCYAMPADALNILAVLPNDSTDDYSIGTHSGYGLFSPPLMSGGNYQPQPFNCESLEDGTQVIYTDQVNAACRYSGQVEDTAKFSPSFVTTLSWLLAAYLAGPVIKGEAGAAEAKRCLANFQAALSKSVESDANQRRNSIAQNVPWMSAR
jgi:hypothetical protein